MKYENLCDDTTREYQLFETYLKKDIEKKTEELERYKRMYNALVNKLQNSNYSEEEFLICVNWLKHSNDDVSTIIKTIFKN